MTAKSKWTGRTEAEIVSLSAKNRTARGPSQKAMAKMEAEITAQLPVRKPKKAARKYVFERVYPDVDLMLPWPPSVNHYWQRNRNGGMHISAEGQKFRSDVIENCRDYKGVKGRVSVKVFANPPDKRKRDLDNIFKALLDALGHAGMIEDDGLIDHLEITRLSVGHGGGMVQVVIRSMFDLNLGDDK